MEKILVIGGAGYIGSVTVEQLIKKHQVFILDDLSTGYEKLINPEATFIKGDMLDSDLIIKIINENQISLVVCLAAKIIVPESVKMPWSYYNTNINGILSVMNALVKTNCKKIIFSSTAAVYGNPINLPIKEDDVKIPVNPYGKSKLACEFIIEDVAKQNNINFVIFRFFNVGGASTTNKYGLLKPKPTLLIPAINNAIINDLEFNIYGNQYQTKDGTALRDYIHVEDLANAHLLAIDYLNQNKSNHFNLGLNHGYTVLEVYKKALESLKVDKTFKILPNRAGDPDQLITSNHKALNELKWTPKYSLADMIKTDYQFRKAHIK